MLLVLPIGLATGLLGVHGSVVLMFSPNRPELSQWVDLVGVPQGLALVAVGLALLNVAALTAGRDPARARVRFARAARWSHIVVALAGVCALVLIVTGGVDRLLVPQMHLGAVGALLVLSAMLGFSLASLIALVGVGGRAQESDGSACKAGGSGVWRVLVAGQFGAIAVALAGGYWLLNWVRMAQLAGGSVLSPHPWIWSNQLLGVALIVSAALTTGVYLRAALGRRRWATLEVCALRAWGLVIAGLVVYLGVMVSLGGWVIGATLGLSSLGGIIAAAGGLLFLRLGRPGCGEDHGSAGDLPPVSRGGL